MSDYERMVQDLMQVYGSGASLSDLRSDQPYRSKDPGTKYRSGELTSDVGFLDPVDLLAGMLASKGATLARGAGRALTEPGPSMRPLLRSQRGSTGGPALPWKLHRSEAELEVLAQRIRSAMAKDTTGAPGFKSASRLPGEDLLTWERRLREYETHYGLDDFSSRRLGHSQEDLDDFAQAWHEGDQRGSGEVEPPIQWSKPFDSATRREKYGHLMDQQGSIDKPRRTVELGTRGTAPLSEDQPSKAQEYAEIIRKLFEREGQ